MTKVKKYATAAFMGLLFLAGMYWFIARETAPKPGQIIPDLGRDHVPADTKVDYNSNPPTSGPHSPEWEKAGIYDEPLNDRKLVHSLEHGYVIISYNCDFRKKETFWLNLSPKVYAHEEGASTAATVDGGFATSSGHLELEQWKNDADCQKLVGDLSNLASKKRVWKLIVVPRANLDNRIAQTAWTRLDKFYGFDEKRIAAFIDAYRDHGPEKTME